MKRKLAVGILMRFCFRCGSGARFRTGQTAPGPGAAAEPPKPAEPAPAAATPPPGAPPSEDRYRRHGLDADLRGPGAADDSRAGPFLRRNGPGQECAGHDHAQLHHHCPDQRAMGSFRVQPGLRSGHGRDHRKSFLVRIERGRSRPLPGLCGDRSPSGFHDLPGHVCDHYPGLDHRGDRRAHEIQDLSCFHPPLGHFGL